MDPELHYPRIVMNSNQFNSNSATNDDPTVEGKEHIQLPPDISKQKLSKLNLHFQEETFNDFISVDDSRSNELQEGDEDHLNTKQSKS
jgi:hypothetical protein